MKDKILRKKLKDLLEGDMKSAENSEEDPLSIMESDPFLLQSTQEYFEEIQQVTSDFCELLGFGDSEDEEDVVQDRRNLIIIQAVHEVLSFQLGSTSAIGCLMGWVREERRDRLERYLKAGKSAILEAHDAEDNCKCQGGKDLWSELNPN
jgi:hypothetical protein